MAEDRGAGAAAADRATMQRSVLSGGGGSSDSTDVKVSHAYHLLHAAVCSSCPVRAKCTAAEDVY